MNIGKYIGKGQAGFTLVELMVTIVVISILSMIAIPAYQDSVAKGRRADAKSTLTSMAAKQEQFFMDNKRYTADLTEMGYGKSANVGSIDGYYTVSSVITTSPPSFTLTAVPVNVDKDCENYSLNNNGVQSVTGTKGADLCW